jgi:hypothetical protein
MNHFSDKVNLIWDIADILRGPHRRRQADRVPLSQVVQVLNERFGTNFTATDELFWEQVRDDAVANKNLQLRGVSLINFARRQTSGERSLAMQQVENIPFGIAEENDGVATLLHRLGKKGNSLLLEAPAGGREIRDLEGQVAEARIVHSGRRAGGAVGFDDLNHRPIGRPHEQCAAVLRLIVDRESETLHVPAGQPLRVGRRNRGVFNACHHNPRL